MVTVQSVSLVILLAAFVFFIGYLFGSAKKGFMAFTANELPRCYFSVIYTDKFCTVLREIGVKSRYFLVTTEVFSGKSIRPKDRVRHIKSDKERKDHGLLSHGYPPLIKDMEEE